MIKSETKVGIGVVVAVTLAVTIGIGAWGNRKQDETKNVPLVTGKMITPTGQHTDVGSFPANMAVSPDGKFVVVTNTGFRQYLTVLSAKDGHRVSQLSFNELIKGETRKKVSLYYGLAFAPANATGSTATLYVSRGPEDKVSIYKLDDEGKLTDTGKPLDNPSDLPVAAGPNFIAGIALSSDGWRLYAVNNETNAFTGQTGSISIIDILNNKVLGKVKTPGFPFAIAALTQGTFADKKVYVTSERDGVVSALDVDNLSIGQNLRDIPTGDHPMALLFDKKQKRLFVANAGSDTISIIATGTDKVVRTIPLRPAEAHGLPGATPTAMALSPDENYLYVTLADMNAVAVVDLRKASLAGYIPTGWYPTSIVVSGDGGSLFVANAKGTKLRNPNKVDAGKNGEWGQYVENIIEGTVQFMPVPKPVELKRLTSQVIANNLLVPDLANANLKALPVTGIKHVIYILKENRTYDQILGDMAQGNGDPSLVLFGKDVTPNQHALAERFVLLDNFYDCAEVSGDGWDWSTSGMTSEYTARNLPFNYSGRGRSYDFEGQNNGVSVDLKGLPDVAMAPGGYLWDNAFKHKVSYRNYGFYNGFSAGSGPDGKPLSVDNAPTKKALSGEYNDENFFRFDMAYADSDAWKILDCPAPIQRKTYGKFASSSRFAEWRREFDGYVKNDNLPSLQMIRFPRNHTQGTTVGVHSPRAMVADNDYAVGQLVEAVSKTKYWNDTAIFVIEDDAQSGHDHVDAHRSICFVISPHIKKATVDHKFYNTDSVLRTMQALLGLPPMCQYDAVAPVMNFFEKTAVNLETYTAILPTKAIVGEVNKKGAYKAEESRRLDFSREDRVPDALLNDLLWHSVKGAKTPEPSPRYGLKTVTKRIRKDNDD